MKYINSRITGGSLRGREIISPESEKTHPMGSRERLAILNSIGPDIADSSVLDLFAGTGALGIEALSRGARHATFVEKNHKVVEILRKNIEILNIKECAEVIEKDVNDVELGDDYNYVFIDPPYDAIENFNLEKIARKFMNAEKIILSHPGSSEFEIDGFEARTKAYAGASITIFTNKRG